MTANLKGLYLDSSLIDDAISQYDGIGEVIGPKDCGKYTEYEFFQTGSKPAKLHIYNNQNGTTTLLTKIGGNQELSQSIGDYIAASCQKKQYQQRPLGLVFITEADWSFLITYLKDDWKFTVTEREIPHGVRFDIWKSHGDKVYLNRWNTGRFLMQGQARDVYGIVATILCDIVTDKKELIEAQLRAYSIDEVKAADLLAELQSFTPSAVDILGETGMAIIAPSLAMIKIDLGLPDYSVYAYPALRGLECYMKALMQRHGYLVRNEIGFGNYFNKSRLKDGVRVKIGCKMIVEAIESSYALYNKHRHGLFHVDANPMTSRLVETKAEAVSLVHEILRCIEQTSALIPK